MYFQLSRTIQERGITQRHKILVWIVNTSCNIPSLFCLMIATFPCKLTVVIQNGEIGRTVPFRAEEGDVFAAENVPALCHQMVGRIARGLDQRLRQKNAINKDVQVWSSHGIAINGSQKGLKLWEGSQSAISLTITSLGDSSDRLQIDIFDFSVDLKVKTFYDAVMFHYIMKQWSPSISKCFQFYL